MNIVVCSFTIFSWLIKKVSSINPNIVFYSIVGRRWYLLWLIWYALFSNYHVKSLFFTPWKLALISSLISVLFLCWYYWLIFIQENCCNSFTVSWVDKVTPVISYCKCCFLICSNIRWYITIHRPSYHKINFTINGF